MSLAEALANYEAPSEETTSTPADQPGSTEAAGANGATPDPPVPAAAGATGQPPAAGGVSAGTGAPADLFSDTALATPEGITAARTEIKKLAEEQRTARQKHDSKVSKFEQTKARHLAERNAFQAERQQLVANLNLLRTGSAEQRLTILSQLTGIAGHELVKDLNLTILRKGKAPDKVAELEAKVQELTAQLTQRAKAEEDSRIEAQEESKYRAELPGVLRDPAHTKEFPSIATYISNPEYPDNLPEVVDFVIQLRKDYFKRTGQVLDEELAFLQVEHRLSRFLASRQSPPPAAVAPAAQAPSPPAQTPPVAPATGQSLTANELSDSHSTREMSEEESLEAIANDPEAMALLRKMGLVRN